MRKMKRVAAKKGGAKKKAAPKRKPGRPSLYTLAIARKIAKAAFDRSLASLTLRLS